MYLITSISLSALESCIPLYVDHYLSFYKISSIEGAQTKNLYVNLTVFADGKRDVHILLSEDINPSSKTPVYEIVIGANQNTRVVVRKRIYSSDPIYSLDQHRVLYENEANEINITISRGEFSSIQSKM